MGCGSAWAEFKGLFSFFLNQCPVVQSIVSLTSSLVVKMLTVLVRIISDSQVVLLKNISIYAMFNNQSFNDTLTNDNVSFEQVGPDFQFACYF